MGYAFLQRPRSEVQRKVRGNVYILLLPAVLILSVMLRAFERPMEVFSTTTLNHRYYSNTAWLVSQTLFGTSYGDIFPVSTGGRTVCIVASIMGIVAFSYLIYIIERGLSLTGKENKAFGKINKAKPAALVIYLSLKYYKSKKTRGTHAPETKALYEQLGLALSSFRSRIEWLKRKSFQADEAVDYAHSKEMISMMKRIERKIYMLQNKSSSSKIN